MVTATHSFRSPDTGANAAVVHVVFDDFSSCAVQTNFVVAAAVFVGDVHVTTVFIIRKGLLRRNE